ncbi:MAG: Lrp/AsnC family transcriptional regulator [Pseudomonadota bacterium]
MTEPKLDERDRRIVDLLQADAWLTYTALAEQVNLSASAVQRRVERLIDSGVLAGAKAIVAEPTPAVGLTLFVLVDLVDDASATIRQFTNQLKNVQEVLECHYVAGENDFLLKLQVADVAAYSEFVEKFINSSRHARRFKTLTSLQSLK